MVKTGWTTATRNTHNTVTRNIRKDFRNTCSPTQHCRLKSHPVSGFFLIPLLLRPKKGSEYPVGLDESGAVAWIVSHF